MEDGLVKIIKHFKLLGISKGHEFIMTPEIAISLIAKLADFNIKVAGCDLWKYLQIGDQKGIVSLLGADFGFDNYDEMSAEQLANELIQILKYKLPDDAELVSLLIMDPLVKKMLWSTENIE